MSSLSEPPAPAARATWPENADHPTDPRPALLVEQLNGAALLQDLGRDLVTSGVPTGGAFDRSAHRIALDLVGCPPTEATLEVVGTCTLRCTGALLIAITGRAEVQLSTGTSAGPTGGHESVGLVGSWQRAPGWTALDLRSGDAVRIQAHGRAYLAARGGFGLSPVLGSRSTCLLGPLGPDPLVPGDILGIGDVATFDARAGDFCRPLAHAGPIAAVPGPHGSFRHVCATVVDVSRIGVRVAPDDATALVLGRTDLASLGVLPGTIQALPQGDWVVLGPDAGTMGGYPVVGVIAGAGLDRFAHVLPGEHLQLRGVAPGSTPVLALPTVVRVGEIG